MGDLGNQSTEEIHVIYHGYIHDMEHDTKAYMCNNELNIHVMTYVMKYK